MERLNWIILLLFMVAFHKILSHVFDFGENVKTRHVQPRVEIARLIPLYLVAISNISNLLFRILITKCRKGMLGTKRQWKFTIQPFLYGGRYSIYGLTDWTTEDGLFRELLISTSYRQRTMKCEWYRYETFKTYPVDGPSTPSKLAANGFYYTGTGTSVKCFCCKVENNSWPDSETVSSTHKRISPHCPFANDYPSLNVPISGDRNSAQRAAGRPAGSCASRKKLRYPEFASKKTREQTFWNWPKTCTIAVSQLASAGLFYTGIADLVRCYCCGIGFKDWSSEDDPFIEHVRYSPNCAHLQTCNINNAREVGASTGPAGSCANRITPRYPEFASRAKREQTFRNWPKTCTIAGSQLALAGLYFTGIEDLVRCYCCGIGLKEWLPGDDPFIEHFRFSPDCAHLQTCNINNAHPTDQQNAARQETYSEASNISQTMRDDMNSSAAKVLLSKGYVESSVMDAIENFRKDNGHTPLTVASLLKYLPYPNETKPDLVTPGSVDHTLVERLVAKLNLYVVEQRTESQADQAKRECERMQRERLCKICLDKDIDIVFLPCGHLVACESCARHLRICAVCRTVIKGTIKAYYS